MSANKSNENVNVKDIVKAKHENNCDDRSDYTIKLNCSNFLLKIKKKFVAVYSSSNGLM